MAITLYNIGVGFKKLKKYDEALKYYTRSYEIRKVKLGEYDQKSIIILLKNICINNCA